MTPSAQEAPEGHGVLTQLDRVACLALLATKPFGRLVFTHRALPDVLPVNYRLDGENLLIRLSSGSTAAIATRDTVVAFEVDDIDVPSRSGWSVTVVGRAHEIIDVDALNHARTHGLISWAGGHRDHFIQVAAEKVTGRWLQGTDLPAPMASGSPSRSGSEDAEG